MAGAYNPGQSNLSIRSGGLKKTGLSATGLSVSINQDRPSIDRMLKPGIKRIGSRKVGFRQAVVPTKGIQPRAPRSVSARAQARGEFSFNPTNANRNPYINPYT
jgi:hypothetical protein